FFLTSAGPDFTAKSFPRLILRRLNQWAGVRDASLDEICLDLEFLFRQQIDLRLECLITGEGDLDSMFSRTDEHGAPDAGELAHMAGVCVIEEYGGAIRRNRQFHLGRYRRVLHADVSLHLDPQNLNCPRLDENSLVVILITRLPHRDRVLSRQQEDFLVVLELVQIAEVL